MMTSTKELSRRELRILQRMEFEVATANIFLEDFNIELQLDRDIKGNYILIRCKYPRNKSVPILEVTDQLVSAEKDVALAALPLEFAIAREIGLAYRINRRKS
jgi:hypothetical protein